MENSFFVRELRALSRRHFGPLAWPLLFEWLLMGLSVVLLERIGSGQDDWGRTMAPFLKLAVLALFAFSHAVVCAATGWTLGARVFAVEHRQRTLESLRLISLPPWRWVTAKLALPAYGLALVWAAAAPFY